MEELSILTESYSKVYKFLVFLLLIDIKNRYPTKEKMGQLASTLSQSLDKIRNWFKHQRKKEVQKGTMKYIVFLFVFVCFNII